MLGSFLFFFLFLFFFFFCFFNQKTFVFDFALLTLSRNAFDKSAHMLLGEELSADGVIELAGVVPDARIERLFALTCGDERAGGFASLRSECKTLISDGFSAKRVVTQFGERLVDAEQIDEIRRSQILLSLADADHALVEGADEYLQLLRAMTAATKVMDAPN